jgi:hypothetical protein
VNEIQHVQAAVDAIASQRGGRRLQRQSRELSAMPTGLDVILTVGSAVRGEDSA